MTANDNNKQSPYIKTAWVIYTLLVVALILILVFLVARDNEEKLFYSLMAAAAAYVFRPTDQFMRKQISRFAGSENKTSDQ